MKAGSLKNCQAIITGVNGFIGQRLARHLIERGTFVVGIDILPGSSNFQFIQADLLTQIKKINLKAGNNQKKVLFHLAGMANTEECEKNKGLASRINVDLTRATLEFSVQNRVDQFIFPSTGLVYGDQHQFSISEKTPLSPPNYYAETKMEAESVVKRYAQNFNMCCTVLRLSNVYGAGMSEKSVMGELLNQVRRGTSICLRDYTPVRDFIFVDDVINGMITATVIQKKGFHCFNLSTSIGTSIGELARIASQLTSVPLNGDLSKRKINNHKSYLVMDNSLFEETTNWKPKYTLKDGLQKLLH